MNRLWLLLAGISFSVNAAAADTCAKILQESCGTGLQSCERGDQSRKAKYDDCKSRAKDAAGPNKDDPNLGAQRRVTDTAPAAASGPEGLTPSQMYLRAQLEARQSPTPAATPAPAAIKPPQCEPAYKRWCNLQCGGDYGNYCFLGAVCDPGLHRCIKGTP